MSALTDKQITACIAGAGWAPYPNDPAKAEQFLDVAIAVCRAESGGDPMSNSSTDDHGLWQINRPAHPEVNFANIYDPLYNTSAARSIYESAHGWTPWSTYKNGSYRAHLGHGAAAYNWLKTASPAVVSQTVTAAQARGSSSLTWGGAHQSDTVSTGSIIGGAITKVTGLDGHGGLAGLATGIDPASIANNVFSKVYEGMKTVGVYLLAITLGIMGLVFILKDTSVGKAVTAKVKDTSKTAATAAVLA